MNLDVGCGPTCRPHFAGVDLEPYLGVKVVGSAEALPFRDGSVDLVSLDHVVEHVDLVEALREAHRVLRPGGWVELWAPHFSSVAAWVDPTHRRPVTWGTWDYFARGDYGLPVFQVRWRRLYWQPRGKHQWAVPLVNMWPRFFERHLAYLVGGCHEMGVVLKKEK